MRKNRATKFCAVDLSKHELHLPPSIASKVLRDDGKSDNHIEARPPQMLFFGWGPNSTAIKKRKMNEEKKKNNELNEKDEIKPKKFGHFRHLNEDSKQWDSKQRNSKVSM